MDWLKLLVLITVLPILSPSNQSATHFKFASPGRLGMLRDNLLDRVWYRSVACRKQRLALPFLRHLF